MEKRNRYPGEIRKLRRPLSNLVSMRNIRTRMLHERFIKERESKKHRILYPKSNLVHIKDMVGDILRAQAASIKTNVNGTIFLDGDSVLIRLEEIDETNFECLFSTIERMDKDWEITKIDGESFFRISV